MRTYRVWFDDGEKYSSITVRASSIASAEQAFADQMFRTGCKKYLAVMSVEPV
jgi:hypothetical protein